MTSQGIFGKVYGALYGLGDDGTDEAADAGVSPGPTIPGTLRVPSPMLPQDYIPGVPGSSSFRPPDEPVVFEPRYGRMFRGA